MALIRHRSYPIQSCINAGLFIVGLLSCLSVLGQVNPPAAYSGTPAINLVRGWDSKKPEPNPNTLQGFSLKDANETSRYFDGLGRLLQSVIKQGSLESGQSAVDLVSANAYDYLGREQYRYLAFPANTTGSNTHVSDGLFKMNPFQQQVAFYNTQLAGQAGETNAGPNSLNYAYSMTDFEVSALGRQNAGYAPGVNWVGSDRGALMKYFVNTVNDSVRKWIVSDVTDNWGSYSTPGYYSASQLAKTIMSDEHGQQVVEYKDKEGKIVLKKVQLTAAADTGTGKGHSGWLCTYYVYDSLSNLRCVIQPEGVKTLAAGSWSLTSILLDEQCFRYEYDDRKRMVMKKVPGAGPVWMVYDARDRLALTQDSSLRALGKWLYTLYDSLNRPESSGLWTNGQDRIYHQGQAYSSVSYPDLSGQTYEELTRTFYDNYDWRSSWGNPLSASLDNSDNGYWLSAPGSTWPYAQSVVQSANLRGLVTGHRVKVLNTSTYLYTVNFYDDKGRLVQIQADNISGGTDVSTTQYSWQGLPMLTILKQVKSGTNAQTTRVLTQITYDSLLRVSRIQKKISNSLVNSGSMPGSWTTIVENEYDKLGQLKTRKLSPDFYSGAGLETISYDYNIRGWLLGANRDYVKDEANDKFGFELGYDKSGTVISGTMYSHPQYNGNIGGMIWKGASDGEKRKYDFSYDAANRLTAADFNQYTGGSFDKSAGLDFSVSGLNYDANGNILSVARQGWKASGSVTIDSLLYTYYGSSNRLKNVIDLHNDTATKLGDFRSSYLYMQSLGTKTSAATDYVYDGNGNMVKDLNKDIVDYSGANGIAYNYLNLPYQVTIKKDGSANRGTITYYYDASGNKLKKVVAETGLADRTTLYLGGLVYENDTLQYVLHEEGRIRMAQVDSATCSIQPTRFFYDYFLKDHLGNVRMVLTEQSESICYPTATVETASVAQEKNYYDISDSRIVAKASTGATDASFGSYLYRTNGGISGEKTGLGIVLKVMAGDQVQIRAESYYTLPGGGVGSPLNMAAADLIAAFAGSPGFPGSKGASATDIGNIAGNTTAISSFLSGNNNGTNAKAFLCWALFDERLKFVDGDVDPVGGGGKEVHDKFLNDPVVAGKSGYLYIYVSNESNLSVFFDNLSVTHTPGSILEENAYYPFGVTMSAISSEFEVPRNYGNLLKFGGKEVQVGQKSELNGLITYDYGYRHLDIQLGRWISTDPLSDKYHPMSPYGFAVNNPIRYTDPMGLDIELVGDTKQIAQFLYLLSQVTKYNYKFKNGKVEISSEKAGDDLTKSVSQKLSKLVYDLIDGDKKSNKVLFNLISDGKPMKVGKGKYASEDTWVDGYSTGIFDVQDMIDFQGPNRDILLASNFAHVLAERAYEKDYKGNVAKWTKNDTPEPDEYWNSHLSAQIFESEVVSEYYTTNDGSAVSLPPATLHEYVSKSGAQIEEINYGSMLTLQFVFPDNKKITSTATLIPRTNYIKRKE